MRNVQPQGRRPLRVELVGPAGVGKSTLSAALLRHWDATPGTIWGRPVLPLLGNAVRMLPTFSGLCWYARSPLWDEARHLVRLRTLHQSLLLGTPVGKEVTVYDEGPIFVLAWLRGFGHETMRSGESEQWWQDSLAEWAQAIDAIVVLDAPDSTLAARIRTRSQPHEVKGFSDPAISAWMARFRTALAWVLAGLAAQGGPVVVRLATDRTPPERVAEQVLQELEGRRHAG